MVDAGYGQFDAIRRYWTIQNVLDANDMLDLKDEAEINAAEAQRDAIESAQGG